MNITRISAVAASVFVIMMAAGCAVTHNDTDQPPITSAGTPRLRANGSEQAIVAEMRSHLSKLGRARPDAVVVAQLMVSRPMEPHQLQQLAEHCALTPAIGYTVVFEAHDDGAAFVYIDDATWRGTLASGALHGALPNARVLSVDVQGSASALSSCWDASITDIRAIAVYGDASDRPSDRLWPKITPTTPLGGR
jgi:hypothetical protein